MLWSAGSMPCFALGAAACIASVSCKNPSPAPPARDVARAQTAEPTSAVTAPGSTATPRAEPTTGAPAPPAPVAEEPVAPKLHFSQWAEGADAGDGTPGFSVVTRLVGAPAISSDGRLALVRFNHDGTICGRPKIMLLDVASDTLKRVWTVPQPRCTHSDGLPISKGTTFVDNPNWKKWEAAFADETGRASWIAMTVATPEPGDPNSQDFEIVKRARAGDLVVALEESANKHTLLTLSTTDGVRIASRDLVQLHAKDRISTYNVETKREVRQPWLGEASRRTTLYEVYVSTKKSIAIARVGTVAASDFDSFPIMDHVLAPASK